MSERLEQGGENTPCLLLVDDSATNRALASSLLARLGYTVDHVDSGPKAVDAVRAGNYAAVLMDIWMPGMDGFEATAAIRALPSPNGTLPIIAMTAHAGDKERRRCLDSGMDDHVGKPIDRAELAAVLRRFVGPPTGRALPDDRAREPQPLRDGSLVSDDVLEQLRKDAGPALVKELIAAYMGETEERLISIEEANANGNLQDIAVEAHSLKSSSGTFGALGLQALAARLEAAAMQGDKAGMDDARSSLSRLVSDTWSEFGSRGYRRDRRRA